MMTTALPAPEPRARPAPVAGTSSAESRRGRIERARLASEIVVAYIQARRALRHASVAEAVTLLRPRPRARAATLENMLSEARGLGNAVRRTLSVVPGDTRCLTQALVLTRLLARRGIPAKLVIGARAAPSFAAHAWVEHAGQPLLWTGDGLFGRLVEL
jgi:transglutaminase-like putative cysteine protease